MPRCTCLPQSPPDPDLVRHLTKDHWSWNTSRDSVSSFELSESGDTVLFHPSGSMGAAAVRANKELNKDTIAYWQILVSHRLYGTSIMFGIGDEEARLELGSFGDLLGIDDHSWGLSHKGTLHHSGLSVQFTEPFEEYKSTIIGLFFDGPNASLHYFKDGILLGVAFTGIDLSRPLFPMISSTAARTEFMLGSRRSNLSVLPMQEYCMRRVLSTISSQDQVLTLNLPIFMKEELMRRLETMRRRRAALVRHRGGRHLVNVYMPKRRYDPDTVMHITYRR